MAKYLFVALFVFISLAYVMSAPASNEEPAAVIESSTSTQVDDMETSATRKIKRGIYGGYGFGYHPYIYPFGNFGHLGHGYGIGYGHYPYYPVGHHGLGHGYLW